MQLFNGVYRQERNGVEEVEICSENERDYASKKIKGSMQGKKTTKKKVIARREKRCGMRE
jgi:hypothetical protein